MARFLTAAIVFFVAFNAAAGMLQTTGVDSQLGIDATVDGSNVTDKTQNDDLPTGTGGGSTLFGLYNVIGGFIGGLFRAVFPGLAMLERAGVPGYITTGVGAVMTPIITFAIASFIRGFDL